jgi:hypothetical protein
MFWGNEQLLDIPCDTGAAMPASSMASTKPAPPPAKPALADAPAEAESAVPSAKFGTTVRGIGAASGIVFSGNHVRTNGHVSGAPHDADNLRRQVGRGLTRCLPDSLLPCAQRFSDYVAQAKTFRRLQVRQLAREAYGSYAPDYDHWEILGDTDLDTDTSTEEDEQSNTASDSSGHDAGGGGIIYSGGSDIDDSSSGSDSSGFDSDSSMSASSGWVTDSSSDNTSGSSEGAQMAHILVGGAISSTSGDDDDWDPAASP